MKAIVITLCIAAMMVGSVTSAIAIEEKHPAEFTVVEAEGEAPASESGAREKAIADALRNAVMKGAGVYVDATTVGSDYNVVSDEIFLKANGFVKLDEVISSKTSGGILKVTIRASVSNRPLVEKLKELGLAHEWKVGVLVSDTSAEAAITRELMLSGFRVIDEARRKQLIQDEMAARAGDGDPSALQAIGREYNVDIIIAGELSVSNVDSDDQGGIEFFRSRGRIDARAYYTDTGEIISVTDASLDAIDQSKKLSAARCAKGLGAKAGAIIAKDILIAPIQMTPFVSVKIGGFDGVTEAKRLEDALKNLAGVSRVKRQRYSDGVLELNVYVNAEYRNELAERIEKCSVGKRMGISIDTWSKTFIHGEVTKG